MSTNDTAYREMGSPAREGKPYGLEIVSTGYGYPSLEVDDDEFWARSEFPFTGDREALAAGSGLKFRRWCAPGETTWTMARAAVAGAVARAPGIVEEIDLVLVASGTTVSVLHPPVPENPGAGDLAPLVLHDLGRTGALGLDIKACYCAGFMRCIEVADAMLANANYRAALIVATEWGSRLATSASNRSTYVYLCADAAGAAILRKTPPSTSKRSGVIDYVNITEADKHDYIGIGEDGCSMTSKGQSADESVYSALVRAGRTLLVRNGLTPSDVNWLLPVQGHHGLINAVSQSLEWPWEKVLWFGDKGGYAGGASIPSCLAEQIERGVVKPGDRVLSIAAGAGLSVGAALFVV